MHQTFRRCETEKLWSPTQQLTVYLLFRSSPLISTEVEMVWWFTIAFSGNWCTISSFSFFSLLDPMCRNFLIFPIVFSILSKQWCQNRYPLIVKFFLKTKDFMTFCKKNSKFDLFSKREETTTLHCQVLARLGGQTGLLTLFSPLTSSCR